MLPIFLMGENDSKVEHFGTNYVKNVNRVVATNYFFHRCYLKGTVSDVFHPKVSLNSQPHFEISQGSGYD